MYVHAISQVLMVILINTRERRCNGTCSQAVHLVIPVIRRRRSSRPCYCQCCNRDHMFMNEIIVKYKLKKSLTNILRPTQLVLGFPVVAS